MRLKKDIENNDPDGDADRFGKSLQEYRTKGGNEHEGDGDTMMKKCGRIGILHDMRGRVRRRQGNGNNKTRGRKTEQTEHKQFSSPLRQQVFQHRDRAIPVGARRGHAMVHRQRAEQG